MPMDADTRVTSPPDGLPVLEGARIRLRGHRGDDLQAFFELYSDPQVMRYWSLDPGQACATQRVIPTAESIKVPSRSKNSVGFKKTTP